MQTAHSKMMQRNSRGLTLTEIAVVLVIAIAFVGIALPLLAHYREHSRRQACYNNMRAMGCALNMYAQNPDNGSLYPTRSPSRDDPELGDSQEAFGLLYRSFVQDARVFKCPSDNTSLSKAQAAAVKPTRQGQFQPGGFSETGITTSYSYSPGKSPDNAGVAILADKSSDTGRNSDNHGGEGQNVLLAGGTVEFRMNTRNEPGNALIDNDIYSDAPENNVPKELNSSCRPLPKKSAGK